MYCDRLILSQSDYIKIIVASITPTIGVLGIAMGAFFALGKYHTEQRTTRIKELYFDETFLSLTKSIEHTMGGCNGYQ